MSSLLDSIVSFLPESVIGAAAQQLGESTESVSRGIGGLLPTLLAGMVQKVESPEGLQSLFAALSDQRNLTFLDNLGDLVGGGNLAQNDPKDIAGALVGNLFGARVGPILQTISSVAGLKFPGSASSLLGLAGPLVMGSLGRKIVDAGLDAAGLGDFLSSQRNEIAASLPPQLASVIDFKPADNNALSAAAAGVAGAAAAGVAGATAMGQNVVEGATNTVSGIGSAVSDAVGGAVSGAADVAQGAVDGVSGAASDVAGTVGDAAATAGAAVQNVGENVLGATGDVAASAGEAVQNVGENLADAAGDATAAAGAAVQNVGETVAGAVSATGDAVGDVAQGAVNTAADAVDNVGGAAAGLAAGVAGVAAGAVGAATNTAHGVAGGLSEAATAPLESFKPEHRKTKRDRGFGWLWFLLVGGLLAALPFILGKLNIGPLAAPDVAVEAVDIDAEVEAIELDAELPSVEVADAELPAVDVTGPAVEGIDVNVEGIDVNVEGVDVNAEGIEVDGVEVEGVELETGVDATVDAVEAVATDVEGAVDTGLNYTKTLGDFELRGASDGVESQLIDFIDSDRTPCTDADCWFNMDRLTFKTGSSELDMERSADQLENIYQIMQNYSNIQLKVGGYTDNTGSEELNMTLSQRRAEAVVAALVEKGLPAERFSPEGYGSAHPIASNETPEGRAQNRRIAVRVRQR